MKRWAITFARPGPEDLEGLLAHWTLATPLCLRATEMGANNLSWFVESPNGHYVLRITRDAPKAGARAEHHVLRELSQQDLPFAVPVPLPTADGTLEVHLRPMNAFATLTRRLAGEVPHVWDPDRQYQTGLALGHLVRALGRLPPTVGRALYPHYGALADYLPSGYTPQTAVAAGGFDTSTERVLMALVGRVEAVVPNLYGTLPRQLVHRDFTPANVLMTDAGVSAVLDFELVAEDLRALDLAVALAWWTMDAASRGDWVGFERLGDGYREGGGSLCEAEARALPLLAQLRLAWGVVYGLGRHLSGHDADGFLRSFLAQRALTLNDWLVNHQDEIAGRAAAWVSEHERRCVAGRPTRAVIGWYALASIGATLLPRQSRFSCRIIASLSGAVRGVGTMTEHRDEGPPLPIKKVALGQDRDGEHRSLGVSRIDFKVSGQGRDGLFILENIFHQRGGPARHLHHAQDEWFYVVKGDFLIEIGSEAFRLTQGDSLFAPRQVPHVWAYVGDTQGRILITFRPAGDMEAFFRKVTMANAMPPQDPALWQAHGMQLLGPPLQVN